MKRRQSPLSGWLPRTRVRARFESLCKMADLPPNGVLTIMVGADEVRFLLHDEHSDMLRTRVLRYGLD